MPGTLLSRRDVDTSLNFWKAAAEPVNLDFTQPGAETRFKALGSLNEPAKLTVQDARGQEDEFNLERNGFVYAKHKIEGLEALTSEEEIEKAVIPETENLVKRLTGAYKTLIFASRIRNVSEDPNQRADNRAPALSVHSDFSMEGGLHHFELQVPDAAEREELLKGRVLLINVWRPLKTITRDPLAVVDWASVEPESDAIPLRFSFPDKWNELGKWRYNDKHQWYYLSSQQADEPLVFVQWDSKASNGFTVPHSAFEDAEYLSGPPRESIEIKMAAFVK